MFEEVSELLRWALVAGLDCNCAVVFERPEELFDLSFRSMLVDGVCLLLEFEVSQLVKAFFKLLR